MLSGRYLFHGGTDLGPDPDDNADASGDSYANANADGGYKANSRRDGKDADAHTYAEWDGADADAHTGHEGYEAGCCF